MIVYVVVATIVSFLTAWVWYQFLFSRVESDVAGSAEAARSVQTKSRVLTIVALVMLAVALGTFVENRHVLDAVDAAKLGVKVWIGFLFPIALVAWAHTKQTATTLVANAGFWLVVAVEYALLTMWLL